jgi:hypothetical protein
MWRDARFIRVAKVCVPLCLAGAAGNASVMAFTRAIGAKSLHQGVACSALTRDWWKQTE